MHQRITNIWFIRHQNHRSKVDSILQGKKYILFNFLRFIYFYLYNANIRSFTGILNLLLIFSEIPWYSARQYHSCQKSRYAINRCFSSRSRHFVLQWWYQRIGDVFQSNFTTPEHIHKFAVVLYRIGRKCDDNLWRTLNLVIHLPIESRLFDWHTDRYVLLIVTSWIIFT